MHYSRSRKNAIIMLLCLLHFKMTIALFSYSVTKIGSIFSTEIHPSKYSLSKEIFTNGKYMTIKRLYRYIYKWHLCLNNSSWSIYDTIAYKCLPEDSHSPQTQWWMPSAHWKRPFSAICLVSTSVISRCNPGWNPSEDLSPPWPEYQPCWVLGSFTSPLEFSIPGLGRYLGIYKSLHCLSYFLLIFT